MCEKTLLFMCSSNWGYKSTTYIPFKNYGLIVVRYLFFLYQTMENFFHGIFSSLFFVCFIWNCFCLYTCAHSKLSFWKYLVSDLKLILCWLLTSLYVLSSTLHFKCQTSQKVANLSFHFNWYHLFSYMSLTFCVKENPCTTAFSHIEGFCIGRNATGF